MAIFKTRYGQAVLAVMSQYPPQSKQLAIAMEALIMTAMENTKADSRDDIAMSVCEQQHVGPGKGLVCKKCHDAILAGRVPDEDEEAPATKSDVDERAQIEQQVRAILGDTQ